MSLEAEVITLADFEFVDTSSLSIARVNGASISVVTENRLLDELSSEWDTEVAVALVRVFKDLEIILWSMDTSSVWEALFLGTLVAIAAFNWSVDTSSILVTSIVGASIVIVAILSFMDAFSGCFIA
jgi:hypothetical protein